MYMYMYTDESQAHAAYAYTKMRQGLDRNSTNTYKQLYIIYLLACTMISAHAIIL